MLGKFNQMSDEVETFPYLETNACEKSKLTTLFTAA